MCGGGRTPENLKVYSNVLICVVGLFVLVLYFDEGNGSDSPPIKEMLMSLGNEKLLKMF